MKIFTVFSPIGGCGKSSVAMALCENLAIQHAGKRVLYLNLEGAADWRMFFKTDGQYNLSDFLYCILLENPSEDEVERLIEQMSYKQSTGIDFFEPCNAFEDLNVLNKGETEKFLAYLSSIYDYVICDLNTAFHSVNQFFLERSDKRLFLVNASHSGQMKVQNFLEGLRLQGKEELFLGSNACWIRVGEGSLQNQLQEERCRSLPVQRDLCEERDGLWNINQNTEWFKKVGSIAEEVSNGAG